MAAKCVIDLRVYRLLFSYRRNNRACVTRDRECLAMREIPRARCCEFRRKSLINSRERRSFAASPKRRRVSLGVHNSDYYNASEYAYRTRI